VIVIVILGKLRPTVNPVRHYTVCPALSCPAVSNGAPATYARPLGPNVCASPRHYPAQQASWSVPCVGCAQTRGLMVRLELASRRPVSGLCSVVPVAYALVHVDGPPFPARLPVSEVRMAPKFLVLSCHGWIDMNLLIA
jgi:hypothetical protein